MQHSATALLSDGRQSIAVHPRRVAAPFDHADDEVGRAVTEGRKGRQPAFRDSVMLKVAYSFGLRFNELRHLQTVDFAMNPPARQFGKFGICKVRYGKSRKGSPHKPRSVLTVFTWTPEILTDWIANGGGDFDPRPVLLFETGLPTRFYLPTADVAMAALREVEHQSLCPYKGIADRYWNLPASAGRPVAEHVAWSYTSPAPVVGKVAGLVAFYNELVDMTVDGEPLPRPVSVFSETGNRP